MKDNIITTTIRRKYNPLTSVVLAIFFTGLGQIISGQASRGVLLFSARSLALFLPVVAIPLNGYLSGPDFFSFMIISAFLLSLASPIMIALDSSARGGIFPVKRYNRLWIYTAFSVLNIAISVIAFMLLLSIYSFVKIEGETGTPVVEKNETVLVSRISPAYLKRGDLVLAGDNDLLRIIALPGDSAEMVKNHFFVNGSSNDAGILTESEHRRMRVGYYAGIYAEYGDGVKYPVIYDRRRPFASDGPVDPGASGFLAARDIRDEESFYEIIPEESITGRVEGIMFSGNFRRMFVRPFVYSGSYLE